jgi:hypothetical protein
MSVDHHLYRAQAALSSLEHLTCLYSEDTESPPPNFGFGLSVLLAHIDKDITAAYDEYTKPEEKTE